MTPTLLPPSAPAADPRRTAFANSAGPDVFGGVVHGAQLWAADPFDVPEVHPEARVAFARLLARASAPDPPAHGKTLLLLGEAGSGKTHLMRAFRHAAHAAGEGYCGYLEMRTRHRSYPHYLLGNLISSLERPYQPGKPATGLRRLAQGLLDALDMISEAERRRLTDDPYLEPDEVIREVERFANLAVQDSRFQAVNLDVLRGVLLTLAGDGRIHARVLNWLRCEDLSKNDSELLGGLVPRPHLPLETLLDLGRLAHAAQSAALVLLVDQLDETVQPGGDPGLESEFRAAVRSLIEVLSNLPTAVVVIGCLEDLYMVGRDRLPSSMLARIEPAGWPPLRLSGKLSEPQTRAVVGRRLDHLLEAAGRATDPADPLAPFTAADLAPLVGLQMRELLGVFQRHQTNCIAAGRWVPFEPGGRSAEPPPIPPSLGWEPKWNDFLAGYKTPALGDESVLAELVAFAADALAAELPDGIHLAAEADGRFVPVELHAGNTVDKLLVAVCDKSARGGGLGKQVDEVAKRAGELPAVFVRSTDFPSSPAADVSKKLAALVRPRGVGRRVAVSNSDWRALAAFREFYRQHRTQPGFADWQRVERPLAELPAVHAIFALDKLPTVRPTTPPAPPASPAIHVPATAAEVIVSRPAADAVRLGVTRSAAPAPVELRPADLCRHAAFLGGSGSGKTTAALTVIEQLLLAGVPAVLLDRKGDLAQYADPAAWATPEPDPGRAARRDRLRAAIDVRLYTPGADAGRPLAIPVVPPDLGGLPAAEREQVAQYAAAALGTMMGYKGRGPDPKLVILQKAIEVLGGGPAAVTVKAVHKLVADRDDALTAAADGFDDKHYKKLAGDLLTLAHQHRRLLEGGDPLDVDALLGRGSAAVAGKTRLTVVNTQFLGDPGTVDFWVSQFLLAVDRWRQKNPAPAGVLQAVFLFDEADQYLPATRQPASKGPMEGLLKRARSAGVGVFLATQSPGDLDYRCRDQVLTWLVGRVKEPTAVAKLRPMLDAGRADAADRLPGQSAGQFYLVRESDVQPVAVDRNLLPTAQLPEDRVLAAACGSCSLPG